MWSVMFREKGLFKASAFILHTRSDQYSAFILKTQISLSIDTEKSHWRVSIMNATIQFAHSSKCIEM